MLQRQRRALEHLYRPYAEWDQRSEFKMLIEIKKKKDETPLRCWQTKIATTKFRVQHSDANKGLKARVWSKDGSGGKQQHSARHVQTQTVRDNRKETSKTNPKPRHQTNQNKTKLGCVCISQQSCRGLRWGQLWGRGFAGGGASGSAGPQAATQSGTSCTCWWTVGLSPPVRVTHRQKWRAIREVRDAS